MKYVDEFRDPQKAKALIGEINKFAKEAINCLPTQRKNQPLKLMEVCGGHTHSIFKYGIEEILPETIELIHGPGCPVCVMPKGKLDDAIAIAEHPNVIFTTCLDAMRNIVVLMLNRNIACPIAK